MKIELDIRKDLIALAGDDYAESIYNNQVKDNLKNGVELGEEDIIIVFPSHIEYITISFIDGLVKDIENKSKLVFEGEKYVVLKFKEYCESYL